MDEPALRDVERWKDKIEVRLDNRQVFFLFFGSALCACMLFVLGVIVGKRLESRGRAAAPEVQDPLAVLDRINSVGLASALVLIGLAPTAWAAEPKGKAAANAKKKAAELHTTDSAIDKQMAWEDKVMGPDDKREELAKIARAQAIANAAAEKAAADKAKAEAAGIREEARAAQKPAQKAPAQVVLPT